MTIANYSELKTAIGDWTDDGSEASDFADTYIDLAGAYFNQTLRTREMEESASITLDSDGEGDLPSDYLEIRRVKSATSPVYDLEYMTPQVLLANYPTATSGSPSHYTIEEGKIRVRKIGVSVTAYYYEQIPALSDSQPTNWLLTRSPLVYLTACEAEHAWRRRDYEGYERATQRRDMLLETLKREDKGARWPNAAARVKGVTP